MICSRRMDYNTDKQRHCIPTDGHHEMVCDLAESDTVFVLKQGS